MLLVRDLIRVLALEEVCIIAQGLMKVQHVSQIRRCSWNGHSFHGSSCHIQNENFSSDVPYKRVSDRRRSGAAPEENQR